MKKTKKTMKTKPLREWASRARKTQKGGFLSLIVAGLVSLGVSLSAATTAASIAAPVISGALAASGGIIVNKIAGGGTNKTETAVIKQFLDKKVAQALTTGKITGGKGKPIRRSRTKPLLLQTRLPQRRR